MEDTHNIGNLSWSDEREAVEKKFQGAYAIRRKPSCYVIPRIIGVEETVSITAEVDFNDDDSVREITLRPQLESRTSTWSEQKARAIQHVLGELRALEAARELEVAFREEWDDFEFPHPPTIGHRVSIDKLRSTLSSVFRRVIVCQFIPLSED